jgi:hypothetical protein
MTSLNPIRYLVWRFHTEYSSEPREVFLAASINIDRITGRERFTYGGKWSGVAPAWLNCKSELFRCLHNRPHRLRCCHTCWHYTYCCFVSNSRNAKKIKTPLRGQFHRVTYSGTIEGEIETLLVATSLHNAGHENLRTPVYINMACLHVFMLSVNVGQDSDSLRAGRSGDRIPVGVRFSAPVQTGPVAHPTSYTTGYRVFPGGIAGGPWDWPPTTSSAGVKERVVLYIYSPSGLSWPVLGWTVPFHGICECEKIWKEVNVA